MVVNLQGSSHRLKAVGGAYGKRKDLIYETKHLAGKYFLLHNAESSFLCIRENYVHFLFFSIHSTA